MIGMKSVFVFVVFVLALVSAAEVRPYVECITPYQNNLYTAFFGYRVESDGMTASPNVVRGATSVNPGEPSVFSEGRNKFAFSADFLSEVTWAVSSGSVSVKISDSSYLCPSVMRVKLSFSSLGNLNSLTLFRMQSRTGLGSSNFDIIKNSGELTAIVEFVNVQRSFGFWVSTANVYSPSYWSGASISGVTKFEILSTGREKPGVFLPSVHSCIINPSLNGYGSCNEKTQAYYSLDTEDHVNSNIVLGTYSSVEVSDVFNVYGSFNTGDSSSLTTLRDGLFNVHGLLTLNENTVLVQAYSSLFADSMLMTNSTLYLFGNMATTGNFEIADTMIIMRKGASYQITGNFIGTTGSSNITLGVTSRIDITGDLDASNTDLLLDISFLDLGKLSTKTDAIKLVSYSNAASEFSSISVTSNDFCVQTSEDYRDDGLYVTFTVENANSPCPVSSSSSVAIAIAFIFAALLL
eukprot:TRINITY_DN8154_c0_g1_i1.p1 TRINITY_DN8154_c0_g1~~TRINITY_DN8154_c0_g1_i1.p1  ORF type:complete len:465 (-),score=82.27 TRINITY_DN8154_c0_g1_i1:27-1421(-)